ncbi:MAG: sigma-70 family RNA polymerase sigma factor [Chitinophagaceae bacterium]|nr:sigma-70 family RNA polymerase sigma factor [Chitinophagaceae bacterium]
MTATYDDTLITRFRDGDTDAFGQLFDQLVRPLVYFAIKHIENKQEAEDMAAFAFQQAWNQRVKFNKFTSLRSFLYTTVRNKCLDYLKHERVKASHKPALQTAFDQPQQWTDAKIIEAETLSLIYQEIERLPQHHREMITLSFMEDLSTEEIALRLGKSMAHVRTARARAIAVLRKVLAEKGLLYVAIVHWLNWPGK